MADSLVVGAQVGSYRIESVIGGGPMSVTYRARHVRLNTPAAIKVLAPGWGGSDEARSRFLDDVHLAAALDHPNVLPILDAGVEEDSVYVVMRHVAGGDLKALLGRGGALDPRDALSIAGPVGGALDAAHARGLVHGAVKPSNILVRWSPEGEVEHVYLADFGASRGAAAAEGVSRAGPALDRFDYLAPEQLEGAEPGPPADVYALGCVLYHALTGRAPFARRFGAAVLESKRQDHVDPPSAERRDLPAAVDGPVLRAMASEPESRYLSCREMTGAVAAALAGAADRAPAAPPPPAAAEPQPAPVPRPPAPTSERAATPPPAAAEPQPAPAGEGAAAEPQPAPAASAPGSERAAREPQPAAAAPAARERRRPVKPMSLAVVACALVAAVIGYTLSTLGGDGGEDEGPDATRASTAAAGSAAGGGPLRTIANRDLADLRCTVTPAAPGGPVVANARCVPEKAGGAPVRRVSLTLFSDRSALRGLYERSRSLAGGAAVSTPGDCRGGGGGYGRWSAVADGTRTAGRMFCLPGGSGTTGESRIVWTADDALVLTEATATDAARLAGWWVDHRGLRPAAGEGGRDHP